MAYFGVPFHLFIYSTYCLLFEKKNNHLQGCWKWMVLIKTRKIVFWRENIKMSDYVFCLIDLDISLPILLKSMSVPWTGVVYKLSLYHKFTKDFSTIGICTVGNLQNHQNSTSCIPFFAFKHEFNIFWPRTG